LIPTSAIAVIFVVGAIVIYFIPDRYKPWWEQKRPRTEDHMNARASVIRIETAMERPLKVMVRHFENRLFELSMTVAMLGIALWIMIFPGSIEAGSFKYLLRVVSPAAVLSMYAILGLARFAALIANGSWQFYGPLVRALGALLAAFAWAQMSGALFLWSSVTGKPPSIGIPVYGTLAFFELISMYRALARGKDGSGRQSDP
jgi:hypothetical protein